MTNYWVLQANPDLYDIDRALTTLDEVRWRVPQHTGSIAVGDGVIIWRSGDESGVIGVGRIIGLPAEMEPAADDTALSKKGDDSRTTRVPTRIAPTDFLSKAEVANLPGWEAHGIIVAPMGTVFPVTPQQWATIQPSLAELPALQGLRSTAYPPAFAWSQRGKDTYPLPGGYTGYLVSLRRILTEVGAHATTRTELETWMRAELGVSESNARLGSGFLLRIGALIERGTTIELGDHARSWFESHDDATIIALLHSRVRFIGEFLQAAIEPKTDSEILDIANGQYDCGWQTMAQIRRRRGWLESAGMLEEVGDDRLQTTAAGRALIEQIEVHGPIERQAEPPTPAATSSPPRDVESPAAKAVGDPNESLLRLIEQLHTTGNDGALHEQFEIATAEAFQRLGFTASWLGKSGRTDVLLQAELGRDASYRVIVDCKSTGRQAVSNQIDWDTIDEHRKLHNADYALIVAPAFGGGRLPDRARTHRTVLITVDELTDLLRQHERVTLGLDDYRQLFMAETSEEGVAALDELALAAERRLQLVQAVIALLKARGGVMGAMSARDFFSGLIGNDDLPDATEDEITEILDALASPLVGLLHKNSDGMVRFASSPQSGVAALSGLARALVPHDGS